MTVNKFESVSSLVDNYQQNSAQLEDLNEDSQMSDAWRRYHLVGDLMRDEQETVSLLPMDFAAQIAGAIDQEPTVLAPKTSPSVLRQFKAKVVQLSKPLGQIAIAASAAGIMIIGVQQNVAVNNTVIPNQIQTVPFGGVASPVSLNFQQDDKQSKKQAYAQQQRRFQALLSDHQQQIKLSSINGAKNTDNNAGKSAHKQLPQANAKHDNQDQQEKVEQSNK
jgi:sigma-E factor negative regulatory protein RseA